MLKAQIGASLDSTATGKDTAYNLTLSNMQLWLSSEHDWPFLEHRWDLTCSAGSQYLTIPTAAAAQPGDLGASVAINFEREVKVSVYYNTKYWPVDYGIGDAEYSIFNPAIQGSAIDPIQRWRFATDTSEAANANKIEIWPMPVTEQTLRFTGQRALLALSADGDKADLDDLLLVLFAAAELLAFSQQQNAQMCATRAQTRLKMLLGQYPQRTRSCIVGGPPSFDRRRVRAVPIVGVAHS